MTLKGNLKDAIAHVLFVTFSKANGVNFMGEKYVFDKKLGVFITKDGLMADEDEFKRRSMDIIESQGLDALNVSVFTPSPTQLKGFAIAVYGRKLAKEIKRNPRSSGKKMKRAYEKMF